MIEHDCSYCSENLEHPDDGCDCIACEDGDCEVYNVEKQNWFITKGKYVGGIPKEEKDTTFIQVTPNIAQTKEDIDANNRYDDKVNESLINNLY